MSLRTFASRTFAARTFASRTWSSRGDGLRSPGDGWKSPGLNRVVVADGSGREVQASGLSRVVWARPEGR